MIKIFDYLRAESKNQFKQLVPVCHLFKNVLENYLKFQNTFFYSPYTDNYQFSRTKEEIKLFQSSHKKFEILKISAEIDQATFLALQNFWEDQGEEINSVICNCNAIVSSSKSIHQILNVINSVEFVELSCKKFVSDYVLERELPKEMTTINFNNLKCLSFISEYEDQKLFSPELLSLIDAPQLENFYYTDVRFSSDYKIFECLKKFKKLKNVEIFENHYKWGKIKFLLANDQNNIDLYMDHCCCGISYIEEFLENQFHLVKALNFNDFHQDTDTFDNFFTHITENLCNFNTKGYFVEILSRKFRFNNVKVLTITNFNDFSVNIRQIASSFPNVQELYIYNYHKNLLNEHETDLIKLYFSNLNTFVHTH